MPLINLIHIATRGLLRVPASVGKVCRHRSIALLWHLLYTVRRLVIALGCGRFEILVTQDVQVGQGFGEGGVVLIATTAIFTGDSRHLVLMLGLHRGEELAGAAAVAVITLFENIVEAWSRLDSHRQGYGVILGSLVVRYLLF